MKNLNFFPFELFKKVKLKRCGGKLKEVSEIPTSLKHPLIKSKNGNILAYKSGARSAIYYKNGKSYRIKGCGLNDEGFVYEEYKVYIGENHIIKRRRLRGCQYIETCKKELEVSRKLGAIFKNNHMFFPNKPLGYYIYETDLKEKPCASLYETSGEIRLNDDLLFFLESNLTKYNTHIEDLFQLYYKFGLQVGYIKKIMNDTRYLWGTYFGIDDRIFHSNAHINNIVVSKINNNLVLGPLDFDLAYLPNELNKKSFLHKVKDENITLEASIKGWKTFTPPLKICNYIKDSKIEKIRCKLRNQLFNGYLNGSESYPDQIKFSELVKFF